MSKKSQIVALLFFWLLCPSAGAQQSYSIGTDCLTQSSTTNQAAATYKLCPEGFVRVVDGKALIEFNDKQAVINESFLESSGYTRSVERGDYKDYSGFASDTTIVWRDKDGTDVFALAEYSGEDSKQIIIVSKSAIDMNGMKIGLKPNRKIRPLCKRREGTLTCKIAFIRTNNSYYNYYSTDINDLMDKWVVSYYQKARANSLQLPAKVGDCTATSIVSLVDRFGAGLLTDNEHINTGSAVNFSNGGYQVSYDKVGAIFRSRVGDNVKMCLVYVPKNCPQGDQRGRVYYSINLRTGESWKLPDDQHSCGGA